jgi:membrane-associated phospholipid phosphatase
MWSSSGCSRTIGTTGSPTLPSAMLLVLAVLTYFARGPRGLGLVVVGPLSAMITTSIVLKPLIDRTHDGGLAFPDGHTTSFASIAATAAVLLLGWAVVPLAVRRIGVLGLLVLVAMVGAALVGRGYHYPTDTVAGLGVALAVVLVAAVLIDVVADAAARRRH